MIVEFGNRFYVFLKNTLLLLILLFSAGCNQSYNFFNGSFNYEPYNGIIEQIVGEPVDIDILGFKILWIEDTVLLVSTRDDPEKLVSVYSLKDYRPLYEGIILKGNGPNEYLQTSFVSSHTDEEGIKVWLSVNNRRRLLCIDITRSILDKKLLIIKDIDLSKLDDLFALFRISVQSDTCIILERVYNNVHISQYNSISGKENSIGWLYREEVDRKNVTDIASTGFFYDPDKSIIVSGMVFFNQINFFNLKHPEKSFSVSTDRNATRYNSIKIIDVEERSQYYLGPCGSDDFLIFGFLNGKKMSDYESIDNNLLHIVNWEGKICRVFSLNRPFSGDAFDNYTGNLYGTDNETQEILKYKIHDNKIQ